MAQLRKNLTEKMESNPGKVHFRRWKPCEHRRSHFLDRPYPLSLLIAALANFIAPPMLGNLRLVRLPMPRFIFGTDDKGRDVLSRMMYGARIRSSSAWARPPSLWYAAPSSALLPLFRANGSLKSSCASSTSSCPSRHRAGCNLRRRVRHQHSLAHLRDRLFCTFPRSPASFARTS